MNTRKITLLLAAALFLSPVYADEIEDKVNPQYYETLLKNHQVTVTRDNGSTALVLLPESKYSEQIKSKLIEKEEDDYPFTYESIYLINKKEALSKNKSTAKDITISDISKISRSFSKMQGMKYFSSTRKKELVLYDRCYTIANANSSSKIADNTDENADGLELYCLQNDRSFGICRYKINFYQSQNELLINFENQDTLGMGPFKAIYPGKLTIKILALDCGEDILLYFCTDLGSVKLPGVKKQIRDSMVARIDALFKWVMQQF